MSLVSRERTEDGSLTLFSSQYGAHYHSLHGAVQESLHVFIKSGFLYYIDQFKVREIVTIGEFGFGTGLNAYLTLEEAEKHKIHIQYTGFELHPLQKEDIQGLYDRTIIRDEDSFAELHAIPWEVENGISDHFRITKAREDFRNVDVVDQFDIVYYDAFGPGVQPDLWGETLAEILFNSMREPGVMVTFSVKGSFRRALQAAGFSVDKIEGPPGKREMTRAIKT
jgi:tRNA U34 5-methylaminomethyl-2-thiouridine-forming methyltransferase MnmC